MTLELDPDRRLALAYVPAARRPAVEALWRLDVAFASVLATGRDPMVSRIRLAWWRESLEKLDEQEPPPEPLLQALARHVLPMGVSGAALAEMEPGWSALLSAGPLLDEEFDAHAAARGGRLFRLTARLLGDEEPDVEKAGEVWALVDLARHSSVATDARNAVAAARMRRGLAEWPLSLRPLGMLALLAAKDAQRGPDAWSRQGSPARMLRMLRHRLTGR